MSVQGVYKRSGMTSRLNGSAAMTTTPVMLVPYDRRRVAIVISWLGNPSAGEFSYYLGRRNDGVNGRQSTLVISYWGFVVYRRSEIGGIVCGEVWGSCTGASNTGVVITELLDDKL